MTRNLKWYIAFSVAWSVMFFVSLNWGLDDPRGRWPYIAIAGVTYGVGFWLLGYLLGRSDEQSAVRYSLRHAYAAVSSIVSATIGTLWTVFFRPATVLSILYIAIIVILALVGVAQARRSIKGMSNEELFQ